MFDILREKPRTAVVVLFLPALITTIYLISTINLTLQENDGYLGAVLDDTWIHVRFAHHIAQGEGLSYNEGVITTGATSPLWVLALGAVFAVTNPETMQQVHTAIIMSAIGQVLVVLAISGFGWWLTRQAWVGLLAGLITAVTGRMIWMGLSGMEITTFTALCILALWSHVDDVRAGRVFGWRTGILTALATLARPEGYLLAVLIGLDAFVFVPLRDDFRGMGQWVRRVFPGWRGIVSYLLLAGSYPIVCLLVTGYPLPNTFRAKSQLGEEFPDLPYAYLWTPNVDHGPLLILLAGIGTVFLLWLAWTKREHIGFAYPLWHVVFVLAVLFMGSQHFVVNNSRYVAPAIPFHALVAAIGVWAVYRFGQMLIEREAFSLSLRNRRIVWMIPALLAFALVTTAYLRGDEQDSGVAHDVGQLREMHIAAAEWLDQNVQADDLIALNDVGAIAHITNREVLDLVGLVSNEVIEATQTESRGSCQYDLQLARLMLERPPELIAVFPWWFPCLTSWPGALQAFNVFDITGPTVIGGGEMVVYWPIWENWPMQRGISDTAIPTEVIFEEGIGIAGYAVAPVDNGLQVILWWKAYAQPQHDYTAFVHLIDDDGELIAQRDAPPQNGQFNTTLWRSGDYIRDERIIEVSDASLLENLDDLALRIGLYATEDGTRLLRVAAPVDEIDFVVLPLE